MTPQEKEIFKAMTPVEVHAKYALMLRDKKIDFNGYAKALRAHKNLQDPIVEECTEEDVEWLTTQFQKPQDAVIGKTQKERLLNLLKDGSWHDTPSIQIVVYGQNHLGVARIASRINDLKNEGYDIESRKKANAIWEYKMNV